MNKQEFLIELEKALSGIPQKDLEERLSFLSEIIDDRVEDGATEEDAVCELGDISRIAADIIAAIPLSHIVKEKVKQTKKPNAFEIVLLILGSPIWLSLLSAAAAIVVSVYISLWSIIISLWAVFASFIACSISGLLLGVNFLLLGNLNVALFMLSAALVLAGLSIGSFFSFKALTKGFIILTKKFVIFIVKKGEKK